MVSAVSLKAQPHNGAGDDDGDGEGECEYNYLSNIPSADDYVDPTLHSNWRIALYYIYIDLSGNVEGQVDFHQGLCEKMGFKGRIRISAEGLNGVLSGLHPLLKEYERVVTEYLQPEFSGSEEEEMIDMDVKYCLLREDLPVEAQLFKSLMVKQTKTVISLFDNDPPSKESPLSANRRSKQSNRRRRRKDQKQIQRQEQDPEDIQSDLTRVQNEMIDQTPSPHLSADEWNAKLHEAQNSKSALVVDVRNVYESRVGYFSAPDVPTLLTNTRKYSDLPHLLATNPHVHEKQEIFMYCTGGVRCERVSMLVQALYPEKKVYQLQGGIQTYLRDAPDAYSSSLFQGKNFVFDPRRTDPVHFGTTTGKCLVCEASHDDYDNGHAPSENKEARCNTCRMLILVCNSCRPKYVCWREGELDADQGQEPTKLPLLYCGLTKCVHEGVAPKPELVSG